MIFSSTPRQPPAMTLEGPLGPNDRLQDAPAIRVEDPDALCVAADGRLLIGSGTKVLALRTWSAAPVVWRDFGAPVTALASSPGGKVAVGLAGGRLCVLGPDGALLDGWVVPESLAAVADCLFASDDEILVADSGYGADDDLMARATWDETARGSIHAVTRTGEARRLAGGLHCPMGLCLDGSASPIVSLFAQARVVDLAGRTIRSGFPGYLGRLCRTATGYALACLSRRDPLIEFLREEPAFIAQMKADLDPRYWISPRRSPEFSHSFPIVAGATRLFGEVKPWAPSFSYGLVIETDERMMPVSAAHSRANGTRHAIGGIAVWNGGLVAVSQASGEIIDLGPEATG
jgi:hypothetical protein